MCILHFLCRVTLVWMELREKPVLQVPRCENKNTHFVQKSYCSFIFFMFPNSLISIFPVRVSQVLLERMVPQDLW